MYKLTLSIVKNKLLLQQQQQTNVYRLINNKYNFTTTTSNSTNNKLTTRQLVLRGIGFTSFSLGCGYAGISYVLLTDPIQLKSAREQYPYIINNFFVPVLNLPPPYSPPTLDHDEDGIVLDVSEVVGKQITMAVRFNPGHGAILVNVDSHDSIGNVSKKAQSLMKSMYNNNNIPLQVQEANIMAVEPQDVLLWQGLNPQQLESVLNEREDPKIPEIPTVLSKETIELALGLCYKVDMDLAVRLKLERDPYTRARLEKSLADVDQRRIELEKLLLGNNKLPSSSSSSSLSGGWRLW
jgi:hypothetical protein